MNTTFATSEPPPEGMLEHLVEVAASIPPLRHKLDVLGRVIILCHDKEDVELLYDAIPQEGLCPARPFGEFITRIDCYAIEKGVYGVLRDTERRTVNA